MQITKTCLPIGSISSSIIIPATIHQKLLTHRTAKSKLKKNHLAIMEKNKNSYSFFLLIVIKPLFVAIWSVWLRLFFTTECENRCWLCTYEIERERARAVARALVCDSFLTLIFSLRIAVNMCIRLHHSIASKLINPFYVAVFPFFIIIIVLRCKQREF